MLAMTKRIRARVISQATRIRHAVMTRVVRAIKLEARGIRMLVTRVAIVINLI